MNGTVGVDDAAEEVEAAVLPIEESTAAGLAVLEAEILDAARWSIAEEGAELPTLDEAESITGLAKAALESRIAR